MLILMHLIFSTLYFCFHKHNKLTFEVWIMPHIEMEKEKSAMP